MKSMKKETLSAGSGGRRPEVAGWREESPALPMLLLILAGLQLLFVFSLHLAAQTFIWQLALFFFLLSATGTVLSHYLFERFRAAAVLLRAAALLIALAPPLLILLSSLPLLLQQTGDGFNVDDQLYVRLAVVVALCSQGMAGLTAALPILAVNARSRRGFDLIMMRLFALLSLLSLIFVMAYLIQGGAIGAEGSFDNTVTALSLLALLCLLGLLIVSLLIRSSREHRREGLRSRDRNDGPGA